MNQLPTHRSALLGRTWSRSWDPADFDPIDRPPRKDRAAGVALAIAIGVALAIVLVVWWSR